MTSDSRAGAQTAHSPQARPGNRNAERHSLYATRTGYELRARRVRRLVQSMYQSLPWLAESDRATVRAYADLEHKLATISASLDERGSVDVRGEPRRLLSEFRALSALQLRYAEALGLTPASRVALHVQSLHDESAQRANRELRMQILDNPAALEASFLLAEALAMEHPPITVGG